MARLVNPSESKVSRTIRLDSELDAQLLIVCKGLGVNPNAYLRQVVGEAIHRHMAQYRQEALMAEKMAEALKMMGIGHEEAKDGENSEI